MRMVNLFEAKKALEGIMGILEKVPSMTDTEKETLETKYVTIPYVLKGDMNRIARTKGIISSFINQIELVGRILINNVNANKDLYDGEDGWRLSFDQLYKISKTESTNATDEFEYATTILVK